MYLSMIFYVSANLKMKVDINTKYIKDANGVNYFALKNYKYDFDYGDRMTFDLKNLFKGSKELSEYLSDFYFVVGLRIKFVLRRDGVLIPFITYDDFCRNYLLSA